MTSKESRSVRRGTVGKVPIEATRWRSTLLHEQFLGGWAGAIPPGYPAGEETYLCLFIWQRALPLPTKAGWYALLEDPQMPVTSTLLDQAHNAIERKLFAMKGFHHPGGSQQAFLTGLAHLYNLIPYQRRAQHAGQCGVEVEGGRVPTTDWFLNLQILTSGGFR